MKPIIAPSILSANFAKLGEEVDAVLAAGADWVHFDVMDNHYVPNLTIGPLVCEALRKHGVTAPIDVHLMVKPVDRIIPDFAKAGASLISFHPEASEHVDRTIGLIRDSGCQAGLVLNPATPLNVLDHVLDKLDLVLIMSVNPGFGGQSFIPQALDKIRMVRERIRETGHLIRLEVDGGIKIDNIGAVAEAGADAFVAGSAIFGATDYAETIRRMRDEITKALLPIRPNSTGRYPRATTAFRSCARCCPTSIPRCRSISNWPTARTPICSNQSRAVKPGDAIPSLVCLRGAALYSVVTSSKSRIAA